MMRYTLLTVLLVLMVFSTRAQETVSIDQFAWLTGHWIGDGFGGESEEIWSEPKSGSMVGLFRHINKGENNFYEIFSLYEDKGSITFRLKHFNPDMVAWEDKEDFVEFKFISVEKGKAVFKGLIYELIDDNTMKVTLTLHSKEKVWDEVFTFKRSESFPKQLEASIR